MIEPEEFIKLIRDSQPKWMVKIFTQGSCYRFFKILKAVYPEAIAYYDCNHVITRIGDKYYDIRGETQRELHLEMEVHFPESLKFYEHQYYKRRDKIIEPLREAEKARYAVVE